MKRRRSEEHVACMGDIKNALNFRLQNLHRRYDFGKIRHRQKNIIMSLKIGCKQVCIMDHLAQDMHKGQPHIKTAINLQPQQKAHKSFHR